VPLDESPESEIRRNMELQAVKAEGTLLGLRRWKELATHFPQSPEGRRAAARVAILEKEPAVVGELKLEAQYEQTARELSHMPKDAKYRQELIRHLNRLKAADPVEQRMIRCLLGAPVLNYQVALGEAFQKQAWDQLLAISTSLAALDEREGWPCIYAAISLVQLGRPGEAFAHLRSARARGYRKPDRLRALQELKPLQGQAEFEAILKEMEAVPPL
jgi:hypothetical protein